MGWSALNINLINILIAQKNSCIPIGIHCDEHWANWRVHVFVCITSTEDTFYTHFIDITQKNKIILHSKLKAAIIASLLLFGQNHATGVQVWCVGSSNAKQQKWNFRLFHFRLRSTVLRIFNRHLGAEKSETVSKSAAKTTKNLHVTVHHEVTVDWICSLFVNNYIVYNVRWREL